MTLPFSDASLRVSEKNLNPDSYIYAIPLGLTLLLFFFSIQCYKALPAVTTIAYFLMGYLLLMVVVYVGSLIIREKPEVQLTKYLESDKVVPVTADSVLDAMKINKLCKSRVVTPDHLSRAFNILNLVALKNGGIAPTLYVCAESRINGTCCLHRGLNIIILSVPCLKMSVGELYSLIYFCATSGIVKYSKKQYEAARIQQTILAPCSLAKGFIPFILMLPFVIYARYVVYSCRKTLSVSYLRDDSTVLLQTESEDFLKLLTRADKTAGSFKEMPKCIQALLLFYAGNPYQLTPKNSDRINSLMDCFEIEEQQNKPTVREQLAQEFFSKYTYNEQETLESFIESRLEQMKNIGEDIAIEPDPIIKLHSIHDFRVNEDRFNDRNIIGGSPKDIAQRKVMQESEQQQPEEVPEQTTEQVRKPHRNFREIGTIQYNSEILEKIKNISDIYSVLDDHGENFFMRVYRALPSGLASEIGKPENFVEATDAISKISESEDAPSVFKGCVLKAQWLIPLVTAYTNSIKNVSEDDLKKSLEIFEDTSGFRNASLQAVLATLVKTLCCGGKYAGEVTNRMEHDKAVATLLNWTIKQQSNDPEGIITFLTEDPKLRSLSLSRKLLTDPITVSDFFDAAVELRNLNTSEKNFFLDTIEKIISNDDIVTLNEVNIYHLLKLIFFC